MTIAKIINRPKRDCISKTLDIVGYKWSLLIIRELIDQPKRFCELEHSIDKITPKILSKRIDELSKREIINIYVENGRNIYELTQKGRDLLPVIHQMNKWGDKYYLS